MHHDTSALQTLPVRVVGWPITPAGAIPAGVPGHTALALLLPFHELANVLARCHFDVRNVHPNNREAVRSQIAGSMTGRRPAVSVV